MQTWVLCGSAKLIPFPCKVAKGIKLTFATWNVGLWLSGRSHAMHTQGLGFKPCRCQPEGPQGTRTGKDLGELCLKTKHAERDLNGYKAFSHITNFESGIKRTGMMKVKLRHNLHTKKKQLIFSMLSDCVFVETPEMISGFSDFS